MVQGLGARWHAAHHVDNVVHILHAHRTAVLGLQQSERVHGRQRELPVYQPTRAGTSQQPQRTPGPVPINDCLEAGVCQISEENGPS